MPTEPAQSPEKSAESANAEMYEAATLLGTDSEMSDVGFAFGAQAEVATAND